MKISKLSFIWPLGIAFLVLATGVRAQPPTPIGLLVNGPNTVPVVAFDTQTQAWLKTRPTIKVAIWAGALPPLHMGFDQGQFEGVSAEYLEVLRRSTSLPLQILRYATRAEAKDALAKGEVDMLAIHDVSEGQDGPITQSRPYLLNRKVIVRRIGETLRPSADLNGQRLAYVGDAPVGAQLHKLYPGAILIEHSNHLNGLASLIYDQADAFFADAITAEFMIRMLYSNDLYASGDATGRSADINFAVSDRRPQLLAAINQTLDAIPVDDMKRITTRWGLSTNFVVNQPPLALNAAETSWLAAHPTIKVLVAAGYAPVTFFDEHNQFQGLGADVLKIVTRRTGLKIQVLTSPNIPAMLERLQSNEVDLIAALVFSPSRLKPEQYTRPYLITPEVIITRHAQANIHSLDELDGMRVALPTGDPLSEWLTQHHPKIVQVQAPTALRGIEMLFGGDVDGTVRTQFSADYFIKHHYQQDLHIASVVGPTPARVSMAVGADNLILKDIINKVLVDIAPEELKSLSDRWRNHATPAVASSWSTYKDDVYKVIFVAAAFVLAFLVWIYYLQIQIRKRRKAEQALGDQLAFSNTLIDGSPIALYVRDAHRRLVQCNLAYLEFMQSTRESVMGKSLTDADIVSAELSETYDQLYRDTQRHGRSTYADLEIEIKGKSLRIYHWTLPFHNVAGEFAGVIGGWLDISEREQLMEQLQLAKENADEANDSKSTFLASMSHEIRTPISALIGLIEMLRVRGASPQQLEENLAVAHQSAQSLLSLIGDILDLSKIEAGAMAPLLRPTNLKEVVGSVHKLFDINAKNKGLIFELNTDVEHPDVMIDALMLNQIIANLISNAIKFTDRGFVTLSLKQLPDKQESGHSRYTIDVRDSGSGLTELQTKAVFEPFVQVRAKTTAGRSTGLGLSICTRLASLLGAQLDVESVSGVGSCFTLQFSAEHARPGIAPAIVVAPAAASQRLNILVAEDHAPNRLLLCQQLEYLGHRAVACENGAAALAQWSDADPPFDLTITDCNMPNMDGYELTQKMRSIERERALPSHPIFGLTANAQTEIVDACLSAGMTQCLFKPIGIEALTQHVGEVSAEIERRTRAALTTGGELQKLRVLCREAYAPLVAELVRTNREDGAYLQQLALDNDLPKMISMAHKIKGGAQLADAQELIDACVQLEASAIQGDGPGCSVHINALLGAIHSLEQRLQDDR